MAADQWSSRAVYCPECGMPAWVESSDGGASRGGAMELVRVRCFARHWFLMPLGRIGYDAVPHLS